MRIAFSLHEAVILLDVFLTLRLNGVSLQDSGRIASERLRSYAKRTGMIFDETYRTPSGVSDRLRSMEAAYYGDEKSSTPATKVFLEAVELYRTQPKRFNEILQSTRYYGLDVPDYSEAQISFEGSDSQMNPTVEVGKFTLESLTTGMYEQPLIIYREYLQNAADSLEDAFRSHLLSERDMRVTIQIDTEARSIEIYDNGAGISADRAPSILLSIGSSQKEHTMSRGFRGIGRLGGISYCDRLEFETTAFDSSVGTRVVFDCSKLKALMLPGESTNMSMQEVVAQSSQLESFDAELEDHYFIVRLIGVDERTQLLDEEAVTAYLSQTAPVTYSPYFAMLSAHIYTFLESHNVKLTEFPVTVSFDGQRPKPLTKAFSRRYIAGRGKEADQDAIYEIETFEIKNSEDSLIALGWYGKGGWLGTLKDDSIRGLRLRKGNIQIGDEHTLDRIFKQARFNGWTQGEVFVISDDLIPNARRDNFEQNTAFFELIKALTNSVGTEVSEKIGEASRTRNDPVQKAVNASATLIQTVEEKQHSGFNSRDEADTARSDIETAIHKLSRLSTSRPEVKKAQEEKVQQLTDILEKMNVDKTNYKVDKLRGVVSKKEKKILQTVSDVVTRYIDEPLLSRIIDEIIDSVSN